MTTPLLIGVVLGADYVVSKSLVTEQAPRSFRGRLMSLLAVAWATGYVAAYLVGYLLTQLGGESWQYMLAASAVPALLIFSFRLGVPESPLWLTAARIVATLMPHLQIEPRICIGSRKKQAPTG
ncbi:MFS transporter [Rhodococcus wratislaviensis]|uniref:MFS transporter n=1 Tax=Rhodococcus wratislaviensis TaxID=44752 RepID=UPI003515880A